MTDLGEVCGEGSMLVSGILFVDGRDTGYGCILADFDCVLLVFFFSFLFCSPSLNFNESPI